MFLATVAGATHGTVSLLMQAMRERFENLPMGLHGLKFSFQHYTGDDAMKDLAGAIRHDLPSGLSDLALDAGRPHSEAAKVLHIHVLQKSLTKPMTWVIIPASGHHHSGLPRQAASQHATPPWSTQRRHPTAGCRGSQRGTKPRPLVSQEAHTDRQAAARSHNHNCQRKRGLRKAKRRPMLSAQCHCTQPSLPTPHRPSLAHAAAGNRQEGIEEAQSRCQQESSGPRKRR